MRERVVLCLWLCSGCLVACSEHVVDNSADDAGIAGMDAGFDAGRDANAGMDAGRDAHVDSGGPVSESWLATKTTMDVWWPGVVTRDPGRGNIEIYTLTRAPDTCSAADEATVRVCGVTFPPYTSDVACEANQLEILDSTWDSPSMPSFTTHSFNDVDAGEQASKVATALIGIELPSGHENDAWLTSDTARTFDCESGSGATCFPDHDDDTFVGVTARFRTDRATYVGPYDTGLCSNDRTYHFHGPTTVLDISLGGGSWTGPRVPRADRVRLGLRLVLDAASSDACVNVPSDSRAPRFDMRAIDCTVDPTTLRLGTPGDQFDPPDPRVASMDYTCTSYEALFVDDNLPQYRVLASGERPGESMRSNGWRLVGREIDKSVSQGTRTVTVRLGESIDGGSTPTCAQVRAAFE